MFQKFETELVDLKSKVDTFYKAYNDKDQELKQVE